MYLVFTSKHRSPQNTDNRSKEALRSLVISILKKNSFLRSCFYAKAFRYIHVILFLARIKFPIFLFKQQQVCVIESLWRVWSVHDTRTVFSCNELIFTKNWSDVIFVLPLQCVVWFMYNRVFSIQSFETLHQCAVFSFVVQYNKNYLRKRVLP